MIGYTHDDRCRCIAMQGCCPVMATRSGQFGAIPLCGEILQRMSVDRPYANPLLRKVIAATVAVQIVIVMASLTVPVLASLIAPAAGIPPYLVGYYSALIYACAAATSFVTPHLLRRWGGVRIHQGMLVMTALALLALLPAALTTFALSAVVLGLAYGPMNPASTVMIARYTPPRMRARVFSLKQTAVPAGGALAGFVTPVATAAIGWRGAALSIAVVCLALAALIQPWRNELDHDIRPDVHQIDLWLPIRMLLVSGGLRAVGLASFSFGAVQFSFIAMFPTVLVQAGWGLSDAGRAMSVALIVGVVCRVMWGTVADRVGPRLILGLMGAMMSLGAFAAALIGPAWPGSAVILLAALFGLSAFCWSAIGIAEALHQADPAMISEASGAIIGVTFLGALAGPALFSTATALTGSFRPAFLLLGALSVVPSVFLLRPSPRV
jgi:MFS family permease